MTHYKVATFETMIEVAQRRKGPFQPLVFDHLDKYRENLTTTLSLEPYNMNSRYVIKAKTLKFPEEKSFLE